MEFHINFGIPGIVIGFMLLGWIIARLDHLASLAERYGDFPRVFQYFLPAVALIQPGGSIIELASAAGAAWVAALGWAFVWKQYSTGQSGRLPARRIFSGSQPIPRLNQ
jgi:hypothetical protein